MPVANEEQFVQNNIGLVHACCKKFAGRNIEYEDLFQVGCIGLLKASRDFDESLGFKFSTYAVPVILGEIKRLFRDTGDVKVSRSLKELSIKINYQAEKFEKQFSRSPTVNELSDMLNVTPEQITQAVTAAQPVASLTVADDTSGENSELAVPVISYEESLNNRLIIEQALNAVEKTDREIIILRFFFEYTQEQIAKKLGITQVQVSRREKRILHNMRQTLLGNSAKLG